MDPKQVRGFGTIRLDVAKCNSRIFCATIILDNLPALHCLKHECDGGVAISAPTLVFVTSVVLYTFCSTKWNVTPSGGSIKIMVCFSVVQVMALRLTFSCALDDILLDSFGRLSLFSAFLSRLPLLSLSIVAKRHILRTAIESVCRHNSQMFRTKTRGDVSLGWTYFWWCFFF